MSDAASRHNDLDAALAEAERAFVAANPESRARFDAARAAFPGGNTRTVLHYPPFPLTIARGAGARIRDADGHEYVDFLGEYTAGLYGHSHPLIRAAIAEALEGGIVLGGPNEIEARLAALICARIPSLERVRFCNSGTEANLLALSTARAVTGRPRVLAFEGAYHGSLLTFAGAGSPLNVPFDWLLAPYNDVAATRALIDRHASEIAAIIVEPMMGASGCIPGTPEFLASLRAAADAHGILLVFDEVMTSRLAPGGLQDALDLTPDLTTLGKYLGGGLTFGAFGGRAEIMDRFDPSRPGALPHAGTFNNNVLTMAAGLAGLERAFTPEAQRVLNAAGEGLRDRLSRAARARALPITVTGRGSMMTVHFCAGPIAQPQDAAAADPRAGALFHLGMLARGQYVARRGMINLSLPQTRAERDGLIAAFEDFLDANAGLLA